MKDHLNEDRIIIKQKLINIKRNHKKNERNEMENRSSIHVTRQI